MPWLLFFGGGVGGLLETWGNGSGVFAWNLSARGCSTALGRGSASKSMWGDAGSVTVFAMDGEDRRSGAMSTLTLCWFSFSVMICIGRMLGFLSAASGEIWTRRSFVAIFHLLNPTRSCL